MLLLISALIAPVAVPSVRNERGRSASPRHRLDE